MLDHVKSTSPRASERAACCRRLRLKRIAHLGTAGGCCSAECQSRLCRLWVSRVASGTSRRSWHVRYASNSDPIGASQRSVAMCHLRTHAAQQKTQQIAAALHSITSSARPSSGSGTVHGALRVAFGRRWSSPLAVADHAGTLPQGDSCVRPSLHGRLVGRLRNLEILDAGNIVDDDFPSVVPQVDAEVKMHPGFSLPQHRAWQIGHTCSGEPLSPLRQ